MDGAARDAEIEKLANLMVHDGVPADEQDASRLAGYAEAAAADCGLGEAEAMELVYEALLYRKLRTSESGNILDRGGQFGAGFS